jgi:phosphoribosylaminoimidazole (AIR) synthetase
MVIVAPPEDAEKIRLACEAAGEAAFEVGEIARGEGPSRVEFV